MDTITTPDRIVPGKAINLTAQAGAALERARKALADMEEVRSTMGTALSDLAAQRADAIRSALDEGLSQADVARLLGISGQAVHNILRNH